MKFPKTTGNLNTDYIILHFPVVCKAGGKHIEHNAIVPLQEIECRWCGKVFCICQSCWRGQAYCCEECRSASKRKAHQEAQRRYRKTEKGKKAHREAENRRRIGLAKKNKKIMDDTDTKFQCSASKIEMSAKLSGEEQIRCGGSDSTKTGRCHFCGTIGVIVDQFPRRGYGKQDYRMEWHLLSPVKG